ncbi:hypothetical protein ELS19_17095 [Halogeometricum borinquense]|uniref:Uncharacterized protein n=1 Tax=Halogeometricum borinquense TaxID=60847 RepID=A0A482TB71_9EURY|nr:hypothetical protein [Halogeometricum borinquense]RYJ08273.1 hypothetical protein ELS19_17095 [Halogeometricum borinquense]
MDQKRVTGIGFFVFGLAVTAYSYVTAIPFLVSHTVNLWSVGALIIMISGVCLSLIGIYSTISPEGRFAVNTRYPLIFGTILSISAILISLDIIT